MKKLEQFIGRLTEGKKLTMEPMSGITLTVTGEDDEEIRSRFSAAMEALSDMWKKDPGAVFQRLK